MTLVNSGSRGGRIATSSARCCQVFRFRNFDLRFSPLRTTSRHRKAGAAARRESRTVLNGRITSAYTRSERNTTIASSFPGKFTSSFWNRGECYRDSVRVQLPQQSSQAASTSLLHLAAAYKVWRKFTIIPKAVLKWTIGLEDVSIVHCGM